MPTATAEIIPMTMSPGEDLEEAVVKRRDDDDDGRGLIRPPKALRQQE